MGLSTDVRFSDFFRFFVQTKSNPRYPIYRAEICKNVKFH